MGCEGRKHISFHKCLCYIVKPFKIVGRFGNLKVTDALVLVANIHLRFWKVNCQSTEFGCVLVRVIIRWFTGNWITLRCYCVAALKSESQIDPFYVGWLQTLFFWFSSVKFIVGWKKKSAFIYLVYKKDTRSFKKILANWRCRCLSIVTFWQKGKVLVNTNSMAQNSFSPQYNIKRKKTSINKLDHI